MFVILLPLAFLAAAHLYLRDRAKHAPARMGEEDDGGDGSAADSDDSGGPSDGGGDSAPEAEASDSGDGGDGGDGGGGGGGGNGGGPSGPEAPSAPSAPQAPLAQPKRPRAPARPNPQARMRARIALQQRIASMKHQLARIQTTPQLRPQAAQLRLVIAGLEGQLRMIR